MPDAAARETKRCVLSNIPKKKDFEVKLRMIRQRTKKEYNKLVKAKANPSQTVSQCGRAFAVGGLICCIGQFINDAGRVWLHFSKEEASSLTAMSLVFLAALLTGLGVYDRIGAFAGAGSVVPITGFSNSIVSPAMEFKREGLVLGVGAKLFSIAGPVLVNTARQVEQ